MALVMYSLSDFVGLYGLEAGMSCEVYFLQQKTEDSLKTWVSKFPSLDQ